MSMLEHTGGPAFPIGKLEAMNYARVVEDLANPNLDLAERTYLQAQASALSGMTLLDYFAAHAPEPPPAWRAGSRSVDDVIAWRWRYADTMLKARSKT